MRNSHSIYEKDLMNIFINSIPKSGTNLLQKLFDLSGVQYSGKSIAASSAFGNYSYIKRWIRQPGTNEIPVVIGLDVPVSVSPLWLQKYLSKPKGYVTGHAQYSYNLSYILKSENYKTIQIFRHPAAVLNSWANYIVQPVYYWQDVRKKMEKLHFQERLSFLAMGGILDGIIYPGMLEILLRAEGWLKDQDTLVVRFEDLVGYQGGGNDDIQRSTIVSILNFLGIEKKDDEIKEIQSFLFGGTLTFREGQINAWQSRIDAATLKLMKDTLSDTNIVKQLDYHFD